MVSSLPFLAPFFFRKAREYRSRSNGSNDRSQPYGGRSGDAYKLSALRKTDRSRADGTSDGPKSKGTLAYATATATAGDSDEGSNRWSDDEMLRRSDEDLVQKPENAIMKSVTYTVRVDHHQEGSGSYP